jgi:biopolymer transport protein ExbB/TolQ
MPNQSLIHADIFFFITTIALVVISIGLSIAMFYLIKILRDASFVSDKIKQESTELITDIKKLRESIKDEGLKWKYVSEMVRNFFRFKEAESATSIKVKRAKAKKSSSKNDGGIISSIFK